MAELSRTQIDQLGSRLKRGNVADADIRTLDEYRRSFGEAYTRVVQSIRQQLHLEPTGRPAKSTSSIIEKLRRESIRLTQVHDIAGCRLIVPDIIKQEQLQHLWAELSEKLADTIDPAIKYGGGTVRVRDQLAYLSAAIELLDATETQVDKIATLPERTPEQEETLVQARRKLDEARPLLRDGIRELISLV